MNMENNKEKTESVFNIERFIRSIGFSEDKNVSNNFCKIYKRAGLFSLHEVHLYFNSDDRYCNKKAKIAFAKFWESSDKIDKEKKLFLDKIKKRHEKIVNDIKCSYLFSMYSCNLPENRFYISSVRKIPSDICQNENNLITLSTNLNTIDKAVKLFKYLGWEV